MLIIGFSAVQSCKLPEVETVASDTCIQFTHGLFIEMSRIALLSQADIL